MSAALPPASALPLLAVTCAALAERGPMTVDETADVASGTLHAPHAAVATTFRTVVAAGRGEVRAGRLAVDGVVLAACAPGGDGLPDALWRVLRTHPLVYEVARTLADRGAVPRGGPVGDLVPGASGTSSRAALRHLVLLGRAWTDGGLVRDGGAEPDPSSFVAILRRCASEVDRDGLVSVRELLPPLCRAARTAPHRAARLIAEAHAEGSLDGDDWSPAAGGPVSRGDAVLTGTMSRPVVERSPMDRVHVGGRPVFTALLDARPVPRP